MNGNIALVLEMRKHTFKSWSLAYNKEISRLIVRLGSPLSFRYHTATPVFVLWIMCAHFILIFHMVFSLPKGFICTWAWDHALEHGKLAMILHPSSCQLSIAPQLRVGLVSFSPPMLELWPAWSCAGLMPVSTCELMSHTQKTAFRDIPPCSQGLASFHVLFCVALCTSVGELIKTSHLGLSIQSRLLSALLPVMSLCIDHWPLQKEASLISVESNAHLWV